MGNILQAVHRLISTPIPKIRLGFYRANRAIAMGTGLENYIIGLFAGSIDLKGIDRINKNNEAFSYIGNTTNPPDALLRGGDAIEVKKIASPNAQIQLNSSFPKSKLFSDDKLISSQCRTCEKWDIKDIIYTIGHIANDQLKYLWMVYGDCYSADKEVYIRMKNAVAKAAKSMPNTESADTNELARFNRVDPLGITNLRVRGMWMINNPNQVFDYLETYDQRKNFQLNVLMLKSKYISFPEKDRLLIEANKIGCKINNVVIKDPNNPAKLLDAVLINFAI